MPELTETEAALQKQNERLKRKLARARGRLEDSKRQVEELQKANLEVQEELEAVKAVVEVKDKHRPQATDKKAELDESSSEEDFEDDVLTFDKTSARDDAHVPRPTKAKNGADKYAMDLMHMSGTGSGGGRTKKPTLEQEALMHISTKPRHARLNSDSTIQGNTLTSSSGSIRPEDADPTPTQRNNPASISPSLGRARPSPSQRRPDVPKTATSGPIARKFHTARDIGISLSKEDERELFGLGDRFSAASRVNDGSTASGGRTPRMSGEAPSVRHTVTPSSSATTVISPSVTPTAAGSAPKRAKSKPEDSVVEETPAEPIHRDQPKIFDENTVRDILCGLSITMSRNFNDELLVPADYSYSYQFKVRRVPQQLLKFKDFAPKVFQQIRQHWGIENSELLMSFGYDNLDAIRGEGKSGAFFIFTRDKRFILKTATGPERDFLWEMLPYYFLYIRKNPNTLLPRFYGVYSMKHEGIGGMVRFVVMNNWFATPSPLNEIYDLKGSTLGRSSGDDVPKGSILKDLDIKRKLYMADEGLKKMYLDQLYLDAQFLAQHNVMDYSLLVGIHYDDEEGRAATQRKQAEWSRLYTEDTSYRSLFQTDGNGIAGWNPDAHRREVYYIGIIDILQKYTPKKKFEHFLKSIPYKAATVSVVEPSYYAKRFHNFLAGVTGTSPKNVSLAPARLAAETEPETNPEYSEESDDQSFSQSASQSAAPPTDEPSTTTSDKDKPQKSGKKDRTTLATRSSSEVEKTAKRKKKRATRTSEPDDDTDSPATSSAPALTTDATKATEDTAAPSKRKKKSKTNDTVPAPATDDISESSEEEIVEKPKRKHRSTKIRPAEV